MNGGIVRDRPSHSQGKYICLQVTTYSCTGYINNRFIFFGNQSSLVKYNLSKQDKLFEKWFNF